MSVTIVFTKAEILELVNTLTINISDPVGSKEQNATARIADVIPLTNDDTDMFYTLLYEAGMRILEKIGAYTTDIDEPYIVTDADDADETGYPSSLIFEMEYHDDAKEGIVTPIVQQAMAETLYTYIAMEWCKHKAFYNAVSILQDKYEKSLSKIKSGLSYGHRATKTYRTI